VVACASVLSPERPFDVSRTSHSTPSLHRTVTLRPVRALSPNPPSHPRSGYGDGAFMEPSGRNQWQPVANGRASQTAETSRNRLPRVATSCRSEHMVRRGSTVRVRQRASIKALQVGLWCCPRRQESDSSRVRDGYTLVGAGTSGGARRAATQPRDVAPGIRSRPPTRKGWKQAFLCWLGGREADHLLR
jgi:hypothetical protein